MVVVLAALLVAALAAGVGAESPSGDSAQPGVWINLGATNDSHGIIQNENDDGNSEPVEIDGVAARKLAPGVAPSMYLYFDIDDSYLYDIKGPVVEIMVEYLDAGQGTFTLQYDSHDPNVSGKGAYKSAPAVRLENSGVWKTVTIRIEDGRFANRENAESDFRLSSKVALVIKKVSARIVQ